MPEAALLTALRESVRSGRVQDDLVDDPDCLAELEFCYSVFRFRHTWGTHYEITVTNLADAEDRAACFALLPPVHSWLDNVASDTMGVGFNGVTREVTYRCLAAESSLGALEPQ